MLKVFSDCPELKSVHVCVCLFVCVCGCFFESVKAEWISSNHQSMAGPSTRNNSRRRREGDGSLNTNIETALPQGHRGGPGSGPRGRGRGRGRGGGDIKMIL